MQSTSRKAYEIPRLEKVGTLPRVTAGNFSCPPGTVPDPRDGVGCIDEEILS
jgi:hypothetical protein